MQTIIRILVVCVFLSPTLLWAASSDLHRLEPVVLNAAGSTLSGLSATGTPRALINSIGEPVIEQIRGDSFSIQAGFFNDYFLLPPTPTITPTITVTCTPIRTFNGELLSEEWVFAAPNPMRGNHGYIHFDLAQPAEVELKIYTPQNQLVLSQHWDSLPAGTNRWTWNTSGMANGVYLLFLKAKGAERTTTVIKKLALIK